MAVKKRKTAESERLSQVLGEKLAKLRQQRNWTQQEVSDHAGGLERAFISRIESGQIEPCLGTMSALAKAFGLTLSDLLKGI
jgi:transcriptional regulator with XRE-family HTH domain